MTRLQAKLISLTRLRVTTREDVLLWLEVATRLLEGRKRLEPTMIQQLGAYIEWATLALARMKGK